MAGMKDVPLKDYHKIIQQGGDDISAILGKHRKETWDVDHFSLKQAGGSVIPTTKIPDGYVGVAHSSTGDHSARGALEYAESVLGDLFTEAGENGMKPWMFTVDIDASGNHYNLADQTGALFARKLKDCGVVYANGEYANLTSRVNDDIKYNMTGMMVSIAKKSSADRLRRKGFAVFETDEYLFMNSDGNGTKAAISDRLGEFGHVIQDSNEMKAGDAARVGSKILVMQDSYEFNRLPVDSPDVIEKLENIAYRLGKQSGYRYDLLVKVLGDRISSYHPDAIAQNCSGNAVGTIDEAIFNQLNSFEHGDKLVQFRGRLLNPRSNGLTGWREFMVECFGENYQDVPEAQPFLHYLVTPSTLTYNVAHDLADKGQATFFTHMSGGAIRGKLLGRLAKKGIGVEMNELLPPSWHNIRFLEYKYERMSEEERAEKNLADLAYETLSNNLDGFIATKDSESAIATFNLHGMEASVVGTLEKMENPAVGFTAWNGDRVEYKHNA